MNMFAKTMLVTAALFVTALVTTNCFASSLKEAADATYKLYQGNDGICSMTFVGNDEDGAIFLTARHCVDGKDLNFRVQKLNDKYEVIGEEIHYLKVLRQVKDDDTAILQVTDKTVALAIPAVEIATPDEAKSLEFGQDLVVLGFPAADQKSVTKGNFTAKVKGVLGVTEQYQTTVPVAGGNSGGGLYTDFCVDTTPNDNNSVATCEYKLIGTTSASRIDNTIMSYFSTAEAVKRVLAGYLHNTSAAPINLDQLPGGRVDEK